jgi:hypothetical protein
MLKFTESNYIQNKIERNKNNGKKLWKTLKSLYSNKNNAISAVNFNGEIISDKIQIVNNFNNYFVDSIKNICDNIENIGDNNDMYVIESVIEPFTLQLVDEFEIRTVLKALKNSTFTDGINGIVLNDACESSKFMSSLIYFINCSLKYGVVPEYWKISTIVPINKVTNPTKEEEYRPINMLPVYEKLLEQIVKNQIDIFIKKITF